MPSRRLILLTGCAFLGLLALAAAQFLAFFQILTSTAASQKADALAVFDGAEARLRTGYEMAGQGRAHWLIVSPADERRLEALARKYKPPEGIANIVEPRAATTYQNALLTAGLLRAHGIKSVLLVTSRYHMPRSYFLLRIALAGTGVEILPCPVEGRPFDSWPPAWPTLDKKRVYNEMIEFWGSLLELAYYTGSGRLPAKNPRENKAISFLRSVLLFKV